MPCYPRASPEPVVDIWSVDIHRLDDIVCAIDILVTYHLHRHLVLRIFLHEDRRHILVDILCQYGLYHYQVSILLGSFDHAQIVHFSISVEVEVGERRVWVVEHLFELLQVFSLSEQGSHSLEVEVL